MKFIFVGLGGFGPAGAKGHHSDAQKQNRVSMLRFYASARQQPSSEPTYLALVSGRVGKLVVRERIP